MGHHFLEKYDEMKVLNRLSVDLCGFFLVLQSLYNIKMLSETPVVSFP